MGATEEFRAGQRVRIRASADSDFAGYYGVIMHVAGNVCDVRVRYKPRGSKTRCTYIGTFQKRDLESLRKPVDHAMFEAQAGKPVLFRASVWASVVFVVVVLLLALTM